MRIYFIAHGSEKIGMGHVMRSLSLAEAFREYGHQASFFSKYKLGIDLVQKHGFEVNCIPEQARQLEIEGFFYGNTEEALGDAAYVCEQITEISDIIVIDDYNVDNDFFTILKKKTRRLIYIDDLNAFTYQVDILINGSAAAFAMGYEKKQSAQLLLGLRYNLLRKEFRNLPIRKVNKRVQNILITTGNSDPYHMTEKIVNIIKGQKELADLKLHVIVGSGFGWDKMKCFDMRNDLFVQVYYKPDNMVEIMSNCDLAISAGGSTLYELAACGTPMIAFAYADNQLPQIMDLEKRGVLKYIGSFQLIDKNGMIKYLQCMRENYEERRKLVKKIQHLVDAKGVLRIMEKIRYNIQE